MLPVPWELGPSCLKLPHYALIVDVTRWHGSAEPRRTVVLSARPFEGKEKRTLAAGCRRAFEDPFGTLPKIRSRDKVQALTFSVDDDPSRVLSYMKKKGYTFPVIVDKDLELTLFPDGGRPPEIMGYGPIGRRADPFKSWTFGRILLEVEKMAQAK